MTTLPILSAVLIVSAVVACAQPDKDVEHLQGLWNVVSLDTGGHTISGAALAGAKIIIKGDRFTSTGMGAAYGGAIRIDSTATPKTIDMTFSTGPEKGNTNLGIYEVNGDTWRICLATRGTKRPEKFSAAPGTGIALETLKRGDESAPAASTHDVRFETAPELVGEWSMLSGTFDGRPLDRNYVRLGKRVVEGTDMLVTFGSEVYSIAKYTVDRSATPRAIDLYNSPGANAGNVQYGIYEVEGTTLKLSLAAPGRERPSDFNSMPGDGRTVVVWTRTPPPSQATEPRALARASPGSAIGNVHLRSQDCVRRFTGRLRRRDTRLSCKVHRVRAADAQQGCVDFIPWQSVHVFLPDPAIGPQFG